MAAAAAFYSLLGALCGLQAVLFLAKPKETWTAILLMSQRSQPHGLVVLLSGTLAILGWSSLHLTDGPYFYLHASLALLLTVKALVAGVAWRRFAIFLRYCEWLLRRRTLWVALLATACSGLQVLLFFQLPH